MNPYWFRKSILLKFSLGSKSLPQLRKVKILYLSYSDARTLKKVFPQVLFWTFVGRLFLHFFFFYINEDGEALIDRGQECQMFCSGWSSVQFSSVVQSCPTLYNPMDCSVPGFPVLNQHPEIAQTHVHQRGDAIQPSHPLLSPSPPDFNLSQHQGLFKWVSSSNQVAQVLEF